MSWLDGCCYLCWVLSLGMYKNSMANTDANNCYMHILQRKQISSPLFLFFLFFKYICTAAQDAIMQKDYWCFYMLNSKLLFGTFTRCLSIRLYYMLLFSSSNGSSFKISFELMIHISVWWYFNVTDHIWRYWFSNGAIWCAHSRSSYGLG